MPLENEFKGMGYCGHDPVLTPKAAKIEIYTQHAYRTGESLQLQTERHTCVFTGSNLARAKRDLMKGTMIMFNGILHYSYRHLAEHKIKEAEIIIIDFRLAERAVMTKALYEKIMSE